MIPRKEWRRVESKDKCEKKVTRREVVLYIYIYIYYIDNVL